MATPHRFGWIAWARRARLHEKLRGAGIVSIHILPATRAGAPVPTRGPTEYRATDFDPLPYAVSAALTVAATLASMLLDRFVPFQNLALVYLLPILYTARRYGLGPSLTAVFLSINAYNYFFVPPRLSFLIDDPADVLAIVLFTVVALVVSNLTSLTQRQARGVADYARTTDELYTFSRKIAGIGAIEALLPVVAYGISGLLKCNVVMLLPHAGRIKVSGAYPPEEQLADADLAAADWAWTQGKPAGLGTEILPGGRRLFLPVQTSRSCFGAIGVERQDGTALRRDERRLLDAVVDQTAVAMERIRLAADIDRVRLLAESERLRNALLTSISHDLRTPLSGIIGALISLKRFRSNYDAAATHELVSVALDDAERLNRFICNLLDMTRLEAGGVQMRLEATDLDEVIGEALQHAGSLLSSHRDRDLPARRHADGAGRLQLAGKDRLQPHRQCRQIHPGRDGDPPRRPRRRRRGRSGSQRRGGRHPARRAEPRLRQIHPHRGGGPAAGRHGAGTRDLPRLPDGDGRHDRRREPPGPAGRDFHGAASESRISHRTGRASDIRWQLNRRRSWWSTTNRRSSAC